MPLYEINLVDRLPNGTRYVIDTQLVSADSRDDAIARRPVEWPKARTACRMKRLG